jgi:hypothetical protein
MAIDYGDIIDDAVRSDDLNTGGLPLDMEAQTHLLNPNSYPFEALVRAIGGKKGCDQMKHEFRERRLIPNYVTLTAAAAAGAVTLTIGDYKYIKDNFYLYSPTTDEMMLCTAIPTTSTVTVTALAGTGGITNAIAINSPIIVCGESHAEGEEVPASYTNDSISRYNYIMQKDRRVETTDIEEAIKHYDASEKRDADRKQAFIEFKAQQDLLYFVGKSSREIVSASGPRRHCMSGIIEQFTENGVDLSGSGGTITLSTIASSMSLCTGTAGGSPNRHGIFGVNAWMQISAWPKEYLRETTGKDKTWGVTISKIITGFGDVMASFDPVMNSKYGLEGRFFLCDMKYIQNLYLNNLPVRMFLNVPNLSTLHAKADAISGTFGLQVLFPELHVAGEGVK